MITLVRARSKWLVRPTTSIFNHKEHLTNHDLILSINLPRPPISRVLLPLSSTHELHSLSKASSLICRSLSSTSAAISGRNLIITFRMTTCMSCSGVSNSSIQQSKRLAVCGAWLSGPKPKSRLSDGIEVESCDSSRHRRGR